MKEKCKEMKIVLTGLGTRGTIFGLHRREVSDGGSMKTYENTFILDAYKAGYAVPAFNYSDIWELLAITEAASEERARVYVASNTRIVKTLGIAYCGALGKTAYEESGRNVLNHLDHSSDPDLCFKAVDAGYMSVMIDASKESLENNIVKVKKVADYAHARGVVVEAELGRIKGAGEEGNFDGGAFLADVDEAVALVKGSGVDSLAVGIGNAHGFYKETPKINVQRLKEINAALGIPLVLHGGTGIPYEVVRDCIRNGMAKVNVGTLLHSTYIERLRKELAKNPAGYIIPDFFEPVKDAVKEVVKEWIRVCGAGGKY